MLQQRVAHFLCILGLLVFGVAHFSHAYALDAVDVASEAEAIDLLQALERVPDEGNRLRVDTAPGPDGLVRAMEVRSTRPEANVYWGVFALTNTSDRQIDRLLVAPYYRLDASGLHWPDLGAERIVNITPSIGFRPERQESREADIFLFTIDPGATVTFAAELTGDTMPQLYLWNPEALKDTQNSFTLYQGMIIGIAGALALFLSTLFIVRGTAVFPAAASLAWAVLAYLLVEFGFIDKIMPLSLEEVRTARSLSEVFLASSFLIFLVAYLHLSRWHISVFQGLGLWFISLVVLVGFAFFEPEVASGIARTSLGVIAVLGVGLIITLGIRGFDRAILLVPAWAMFCAWLFAGWLVVTGQLSNDVASAALSGGLVMIVLLIGFTIMQHAFSGGALVQGNLSEADRMVLAVQGANHIVFDWDVERDKVFVSPSLEQRLGLPRGALNGEILKWTDAMHPSDKAGFRGRMETIIDESRGSIDKTFRMSDAQGHMLWFRLNARPVVAGDGEVTRIVGTILDITEDKTAQARLLHDAVHDNLTGLPNRALFLDRLEAAISRSRAKDTDRATVIMIDVDRFKSLNEDIGLSVGDSILLTISRRLSRQLREEDTLARLSGDQFGILLLSETTPAKIAQLAENLRRAIKAPINFAGKEIFVTAGIGLALHADKAQTADQLIKDAGLALTHAKSKGGDSVAAFNPKMRDEKEKNGNRTSLEAALRRAIEREEISLAYQPIIDLQTSQLAGFEALMRWDHPELGRMPTQEFIRIAEETSLIVELGHFVLGRSAKQLSDWQMLSGGEELFMSVNVSSRQLWHSDLVSDVKAAITRNHIRPGTLKLEVTESLIMDNPEYAAQILEQVKERGASLALDDFGTGYSSLSHLEAFPFDTLKVDRTFVQQNGNGKRSVILGSIITMARELGLQVVAEGVETEDDVAVLRTYDCTFGQGYYFGLPLTAQEAKRLIANPTPLFKSA